MRDRVKREKGNKKIGKKRNRVIGKQIKINKGERGTKIKKRRHYF